MKLNFKITPITSLQGAVTLLYSADYRVRDESNPPTESDKIILKSLVEDAVTMLRRIKEGL